MSQPRILIGVSGGIAAYKACELVRLFKKSGHRVRVMMTHGACKFVTPMTFQALTGKPVWVDEKKNRDAMDHIRLAREADLVILAPASANLIGRMAYGLADDFVTTTLLAYNGSVLIAPAMNTQMYAHPLVQKNLQTLRAIGHHMIGPNAGELACGEVGAGKMSEPAEIYDEALRILNRRNDYSGLRVLVTAGPTLERLDAVRFLTNPSTGKMGYAIAQAAQRRGAVTTLISGPTHLEKPAGVEVISVESARQMHEQVLQLRAQDVVVMAAAVADFSFAEQLKGKANRANVPRQLTLTPNADILEDLGQRRVEDQCRQVLVGFSMETQNLLERTKSKLSAKHVDLMVGNSLNEPQSGFAVDTNRVTVVDRQGGVEEWPLMTKRDVADKLLDRAKDFLA